MPEEEYSKGGYEAMLWIRDKDGKEYACYADALKVQYQEELHEEEKDKRMDVSQLIGAERW